MLISSHRSILGVVPRSQHSCLKSGSRIDRVDASCRSRAHKIPAQPVRCQQIIKEPLQQRLYKAQSPAAARHSRQRDVGTAAGAVGATKALSDSLAAAVTAYNTPLWMLGVRCLGSTAAAICAAMAISRALHQAADRSENGEDLDWTVSSDDEADAVFVKEKRGIFAAGLDAFMVALHRPAALFVPVVAVAYSIKEVESYMQAILLWQLKHNMLNEIQQSGVKTGVMLLRSMDHVIAELDELALITVGVWVILRFKDRIVQLVMQKSLRAQAAATGKESVGEKDKKKAKGNAATLERVVLPFSGLASWLVVVAGGLMALHVVGVNIQPLLTVGGVSGVIVGLSAQSVMANMISGINLFISQPFVVGDRVEILTSGGSRVLVGTVERVDPMRTIFRSDAEVPSTIPNKVLSDMIIQNESRLGHSRVMQTFNKPRVYSVTLPLRFQDFPKVEGLMEEFRSIIQGCKDTDNSLGTFVGISSLDNHAINVILHMHTTPAASRSYGSFRTKVLIQLARAIEDAGAALAYPVQVNVESDENYFCPGHLKSESRQPQLEGRPQMPHAT